MWIVNIALDRSYMFVMLILQLGPIVIQQTPVDMFSNTDIPVISLSWQYNGLNPEEMGGQVTTPFEKWLTMYVDDVERVESTTYNDLAVVWVFLRPGASPAKAYAQVSAAWEFNLRGLPPDVLPPQVVAYSASTVGVAKGARSLLCATAATLRFVPALFALVHGRGAKRTEEPNPGLEARTV